MNQNFVIVADAAAQTTAITQQPAPDTAEPQQSAGSLLGSNSFFIIILVAFGLMIFLQSRSAKKQRQKQQEKLNAIMKGTRIRTIGGFFGTVAEVKGETLMVEFAEKMPPMEIAKAAVADVIVPADAAANK